MFNTTISKQAVPTILVKTISDGYDQGIIKVSLEVYLERFQEVGSQTLAKLIEKLCGTEYLIDCIVYDAFLSWVLEIAKRVCWIFLLLLGLRDLVLQGCHQLRLRICRLFSLFSDRIYQVVDWMAKFFPLRTIGPTIPSMFLDKRLQDDPEYGLSIFKTNTGTCMNWLKERPNGSVVYVSFGSLAELGVDQMEELAWGLGDSNCHFLWVVRSKEEAKLPKDFVRETSEKGLVVSWCPQLQVLAHKVVGCFVTHCGWNSTLEVLSLGDPMVAIPQWTDQSTNAKYVMDVWRMGLKVWRNDKGIVRREETEHYVREVMEGERGK
ncbi:UDP-glycosyltransferase 74F2 [Camellia lanceoleosa]|uniref:UDP-glycosyltransferase 74F2 n=1 Tax=Camellia lanceoleosa TaxID=1840588 RepID=A0ACC0F6M9_9ERIC|nr:UDP-glycosyltransferase 74F2 [Camellia lanceoleosa]